MNLENLSTDELLALRTQAAGAPVDEPALAQDAMQAAATRMRRGVMRGGVQSEPPSAGSADAIVRQLAKGLLGGGSWMDELSAAGDAATYSVLGRGKPGETYGERYAGNVETERAKDKQFETEHPVASTALQLAGGVGSGVGALRAAPQVAGAVLGNLGRGLPARMLAGAGSGAGLGAVYGFGQGEDSEGRLDEGLRGGLIGGAVGAGVPAVARGTSALATALRNYGAGRDAAANLGVPRGAVERVARNAAGDDITAATYPGRAAEMGPEGMVLDAGRQLAGRAEAIASMPGRGQNVVTEAVTNRVRTSSGRLGRELDAELGQSPDIVALRDRVSDFYNSQAKPLYESVMAAHPQVWNARLESLTARPSIQRALNDAVSLAREHGAQIENPFIRGADGQMTLRPGVTPSLNFFDHVKKSLDSRINALSRNPDPDSAGVANVRALLDTKRELVRQLDDITGGAYARARGIAAEGFRVDEALDNGLNIFKNSLLPEQFREQLHGMNQVERAAVAAGARRAIERVRENAPAAVSEGGRQMYAELLQGGPNGDTAQKLRMLLGDNAVNNLVGAARREQGFAATYQRITQNSRTTPRLQAVADMGERSVPQTLTGAVNQAIAAPITGPIASVLRQGAERTREGVADLLTRAGPARDAAMSTIIDLNAQRAANAAGGQNINAALAAALMGAGTTQGQRLPVLKDRALIRALRGAR